MPIPSSPGSDVIMAFMEKFKSPEAIIEEMRKRGIKGVRGSYRHCLIANLMRDEFKATATVASTVEVEGIGWAVPTDAFAILMDQFDDGAYADLRETP